MYEQSLPEDDEEAALLVMAILHHNSKMIPPTLPQESMFDLAKFAHKYDLIDTVRFVAHMRWCTKLSWPGDSTLSHSGSRRISKLMAAAYILRLEANFNAYTNCLILSATGLGETVASKEALNYLPSETLGTKPCIPPIVTSLTVFRSHRQGTDEHALKGSVALRRTGNAVRKLL